MNDAQKRLLVETEYHFYWLASDPARFSALLVRLGYKPNPDLSKMSTESLQKLCFQIRTVLRSDSTV